MNRKYVLKLTAEERTWLEGVVRTGKSAAWKIQHAHALLKMEQGEDGPGREDARIAEAFGMTTRSLGWRAVIKTLSTLRRRVPVWPLAWPLP